MDGVLVNSNPAHKKAIRLFCERHHRQVSGDFLQRHVFGRTNREWIPALFGKVPPQELARLADEKEHLFRELFDPRSAVIRGLIPFLEQLRGRGIKAAVATSAPRENADFILSELAISHYFDAVLDETHAKQGKPDPEIYVKAAAAIGHPPHRCIVLEDSITGVQAGLRAGAKVIGITSTHSPGELAGCDLVVQDFTQLHPDHLEALL